MNVGFISLGCSKNLIDTEVTIGLFKDNNYKIVNEPQDADIIVVNTCGFIESAKEEAINTILEMAEYKKRRCKYLIAMGCLVQRYYDDLKKAIPEVDLWIKIDEYNKLWDKVEDLVKRDIVENSKTKSTNKISEIKAMPMLTYEEYLNRVDLYGESKLAELLQKLSGLQGIEWIRFLYSYPEGITDELIKVVANNDKIAKYFDIPIQHISNTVLKRMNRKTSKENIEKLIAKIRKEIPDVTLRTSLIVGFPGETEKDFEELKEFVKETKFDKLGAFMYSKEDGTPAARLPEQIHGNTKKARYKKIMQEQQKISKEILERKIGKTFKVLVEDLSFDKKYFIGRTMQDVPEEDGLVYIKNDKEYKTEDILNHFVNCKIENVSNYDLIGKII